MSFKKITNHTKHNWSAEEDNILVSMVNRTGAVSWNTVASHLPGRSAKNCRERWHNHFEFGIRKGGWTQTEDELIIKSQASMGNQWAKMSKLFQGRSDNAIKNRWHTLIRVAQKRFKPRFHYPKKSTQRNNQQFHEYPNHLKISRSNSNISETESEVSFDTSRTNTTESLDDSMDFISWNRLEFSQSMNSSMNISTCSSDIINYGSDTMEYPDLLISSSNSNEFDNSEEYQEILNFLAAGF